MLTNLVLITVLCLSISCIGLLYLYYSKLQYIAALESQLMSIKLMLMNTNYNPESYYNGGSMMPVSTNLPAAATTAAAAKEGDAVGKDTQGMNMDKEMIVMDKYELADNDGVFLKFVNIPVNPLFMNSDDIEELPEMEYFEDELSSSNVAIVESQPMVVEPVKEGETEALPKKDEMVNNTLESMMNDLDELSEIASNMGEVKTIKINYSDINTLSMKELKELCAAHNLNKKGTKQELINRINEALKNK